MTNTDNVETPADLLKQMADSWKAPLVARSKVGEFTGGLLSPRYLANLDSAGRGPPIRLRCGKKVAYPIEALCQWLLTRMDVIRKEEQD